MFADDDELALAETAAAKNGNILNDQANESLNQFFLNFIFHVPDFMFQNIMAANENPNLTDNWDDAEG